MCFNRDYNKSCHTIIGILWRKLLQDNFNFEKNHHAIASVNVCSWKIVVLNEIYRETPEMVNNYLQF